MAISLLQLDFSDKGANAIAGILNFYHPDYKKFSLGKYLILQKIEFARANRFLYYLYWVYQYPHQQI